MAESESSERTGNRWRIVTGSGTDAAWLTPVAGRGLTRVATAGGDGWRTEGRQACFALDLRAHGCVLAAGWYELRGWLKAEQGCIELPSVSLHYAAHSSLDTVEVMLRGPDASGRVGVLLLLLEDVEALEFTPGIDPVGFRMWGFSLCQVSRLRALSMLLTEPAGSGWMARARRLLAWAGMVRRLGLKRATDALHATYRKSTWTDEGIEYATWIRRYDSIDATRLAEFTRGAQALEGRGTLVSLLLVLTDEPEACLRRCLDGVSSQVWEQWELCVAVAREARAAEVLAAHAARDPRIRVLHREPVDSPTLGYAAALATARGDIVLLLKGGTVLRPHALLRIVETAVADPEFAMAYSDEDRIDAEGRRFAPEFKPDWNPDLLVGTNYIGSVFAIRTSLARDVGSASPGLASSEALDLLLRCSERAAPRQIHHIAEVLHHRFIGEAHAGPTRDKDYAADLRAVAGHLERTGSTGIVEAIEGSPGLRRMRWPLPESVPKISLVIPTRDRVGLLRTCVESILAKTTWPDFEVMVVDNQSRDPAALDYLEQLGSRQRVRVLRYDAPFNFAAINNWAARQCDGALLGLVNNDIEVITPGWLEELAGFALRPETGAVGAMLFYPDDTIQHAGMLLGIHGIAGHVYAGKPRGYMGHAVRAALAQNLSAITGACLLVRREAFDAVGGLDERFPVEFNDVDFCLRLLRHGYRNVWTPFAELYHHESASRRISGAVVRKMRFHEVELMQKRWANLLRFDPAYNPNLSLHDPDCGLAFPPREQNENADASVMMKGNE